MYCRLSGVELSTHARAAVDEVRGWLREDNLPQPPRDVLARAVRLSLEVLAERAPGHSVEVRVAPFGAVQCVPGLEHRRGSPPNVVECQPRTWLRLAIGDCVLSDACAAHRGGDWVDLSGTRAHMVGDYLPLFRV